MILPRRGDRAEQSPPLQRRESTTARIEDGLGRAVPVQWWLGLGELGVAFDEFFGAAAGEGDGEFAVVFVAFDTDDSADAVFGVADFLAEHGIGGGFFAEGEGGFAEAWRF
jgi:hypothetical protein